MNNDWYSFLIEDYRDMREHFSLGIWYKRKALYIFGGYYYDQQNELDINYKDILKLDLANMKLEKLAIRENQLQVGRCFHTSVIIDDYMVIFGGLNIRED